MRECVACGREALENLKLCAGCSAVQRDPCKGCNDRVAVPSCHDGCARYLASTAIDKALKKSIKLGRDADAVLYRNLNKTRAIKRRQRAMKQRVNSQ